jgi:hypothetical protein
LSGCVTEDVGTVVTEGVGLDAMEGGEDREGDGIEGELNWDVDPKT